MASIYTQPPESHQSFHFFLMWHAHQHLLLLRTLSIMNLFFLACMIPHAPDFISTSLVIPSRCPLQADPFVSVSVFLISGPVCFHYSTILTLGNPIHSYSGFDCYAYPKISVSIPNHSLLLHTYISNSLLDIFTWISPRNIKIKCPRLNLSSFSTISLWSPPLLLSVSECHHQPFDFPSEGNL